jgi:hypothetical protein
MKTLRFRRDNTEGYTEADLVALNAAFDAIVHQNRIGGADWDYDSAEELSWQDHICEELLARYAAGIRGADLMVER